MRFDRSLGLRESNAASSSSLHDIVIIPGPASTEQKPEEQDEVKFGSSLLTRFVPRPTLFA